MALTDSSSRLSVWIVPIEETVALADATTFLDTLSVHGRLIEDLQHPDTCRALEWLKIYLLEFGAGVPTTPPTKRYGIRFEPPQGATIEFCWSRQAATVARTRLGNARVVRARKVAQYFLMHENPQADAAIVDRIHELLRRASEAMTSDSDVLLIVLSEQPESVVRVVESTGD